RARSWSLTQLRPCPTNVTSGAGARVFFVPKAHDACAGELLVICNPPAGSVLPVGTNTVVCSATDHAGNNNQCSFIVTVLGALTSKLAVLNEIEGEITDGGAPGFNRAVGRLRRSVDPKHWLDEIPLNSAGATVFWNDAAAMRILSRALRQHTDDIPDESLKDWMDRLVAIDRVLATTKIDEATRSGASATALDAAARNLNRGDRARDSQHPVTAILSYLRAWRAAARAERRSQNH
ncbi:MAG TPA: HYR domain-containing protein, partial [Candidatus Acidoferrum sp.]|nr:HYR domain-containing protein [Candidatus Acidoferrum sp.]